MYPWMQPQKSIKEQIQDQEDLVEFLKNKYKLVKDEKKKTWMETKLSLWDTAILIAVFSFALALPITIHLVSYLHALHDALNAVMK
jgi:hypothetical protein